MPSQYPFPMMDHWAQQSPIKLFKADSIVVDLPKSFLGIDYSDAPFVGKFEGEPGHTNFVLTKPHPGKVPPEIKLGVVKAELVKIHLHTPSEHALEGENLDGEIHLVHKIENSSDLIVLGIFFKEGGKRVKSDFFQIWASALTAAKRAKKKATGMVSIDPRHLLPKTDKWFRYEGSLTSEPYSENVSWLVFHVALGIESEDLENLKEDAHQPERPIQDIGRRFVLRNFK